ncbi:MAG: VWA domain-containing protein [Rhodovibrionaceae bacterium]|nr:VWA domain-containing protein [Rhodovibrionaceae bacterium]
MLVRRRTAAQALSISALDLFASALGVFVLMFVLLLPFYLKSPSVEAEQAGAEAALAEVKDRRAAAEQAASDAEEDLAGAREALGAAQSRVARLRSVLDERLAALAAAEAEAPVEAPPRTTRPDRLTHGGNIAIEDLDLVIVMDVTASMRDELADIRANLASIARILNRLSPELRMGFVAYRDRDAPPILSTFDLRAMSNRNLSAILGFVGGLEARGGGDKPEPLDQALQAAVEMQWRENAKGRIIVIGDAPAHRRNWEEAQRLASAFRASAAGADPAFDRRVSTIVTGGGRPTQRFFQDLASAGGGDASAHRGAMIESVLLTILR